LLLTKWSLKKQYLSSFLLILLIACVGFSLSEIIGYRVVAFLLLVSVSLLAMFFDIIPVLFASLLSAFVWNFFFIPPRFTFSVGQTEDRFMLLMYFVISLLNAVLTFKIRQAEKKARVKQEKEKSLQLYDTLINSLSHELKTPIATIIGASDHLLSNEVTLSHTNKDVLVKEISIAALRLNQQVSNLLNISRIQSGLLKLSKDWCDIHELVYATIQKLEPSLNGHTIEVALPQHLPLFKIDYGILEQVLYNLLENAIKYTPANSQITIRADSQEDGLLLVVSDNGQGIPLWAQEKVFDKFYRLETASSNGTGLGLSIVKGFVEAHDGKVLLTASEQGGAQFTLRIPAESTYLNVLKNE
jgi:two-component system sensor histidine kinase KdpD